jgi:hypothetical protein
LPDPYKFLKKIRLDCRAANYGTDTRTLRDVGIVSVPDALTDDTESVNEPENVSAKDIPNKTEI